MSIKKWFRTKKALIAKNKQLKKSVVETMRLYQANCVDKEERIAERAVQYETLYKQFRALEKSTAEFRDIELSAISQDLGKIKQELGIIKGMDTKAEAQLNLMCSYVRVAGLIANNESIPYQEWEKQQAWIGDLATALQELQQWTGEGQSFHFGQDRKWTGQSFHFGQDRKWTR